MTRLHTPRSLTGEAMTDISSEISLSAPRSPTQLLDELRAASFDFELVSHPPLHTIEEARSFRSEAGLKSEGAFVKNLFLKDRGGTLLLVVVEHQRPVQLQRLRAALGLRRLSFAPPELLWETLGVRPGSVSPLALCNAAPGSLAFYVDEALQSAGQIHFHPLSNEYTLSCAVRDWVALSTAWGFPPRWLPPEALSPPTTEGAP